MSELDQHRHISNLEKWFRVVPARVSRRIIAQNSVICDKVVAPNGALEIFLGNALRQNHRPAVSRRRPVKLSLLASVPLCRCADLLGFPVTKGSERVLYLFASCAWTLTSKRKLPLSGRAVTHACGTARKYTRRMDTLRLRARPSHADPYHTQRLLAARRRRPRCRAQILAKTRRSRLLAPATAPSIGSKANPMEPPPTPT